MLRNENLAKTITKHISCDCKCKFNSTTYNRNQKWNRKRCQSECKSDYSCKKKNIVGIPALVFTRVASL